jgi:hypothetical protein
MFGDIDLLSDPSLYRTVLEAFTREKWDVLTPEPKRAFDETVLTNDWGNLVEVHWRMDPLNGVAEGVTDARIRGSARETSYRGYKVLIPSPEDRLIQSAVHGTAHHAFDSSLFHILAADLAHILARHREKIDFERLQHDLVRERMLEHTAIALEISASLTRFPPVREALDTLNRLSPGLAEAAGPVGRSLARTAFMPWAINFRPNMVLFSRVSLADKFRFLVSHRAAYYFYIRRRQKERAGKPYDKVAVVAAPPRYRRHLFNLAVLRSHWELFKFYRSTKYIGHTCASLVLGGAASTVFDESGPK